MAFAVSLRFDSGVAEAVSMHWRRIAEAGISRSMLDLGYPPHVTLGVYEQLEVDTAIAACDRVFEAAEQIAVTLTNVTTFGAGSGVCYAGLAVSPDLMRLHAGTVVALGQECHPHYRAGSWIPHCTLATGVADVDIGRAVTILQRQWQPLSGVFEAAELVRFTPVVGVKRWALSATRLSTRKP